MSAREVKCKTSTRTRVEHTRHATRKPKPANSGTGQEACNEANMGEHETQGSTITLGATAGCNENMHMNTRSKAKSKEKQCRGTNGATCKTCNSTGQARHAKTAARSNSQKVTCEGSHAWELNKNRVPACRTEQTSMQQGRVSDGRSKVSTLAWELLKSSLPSATTVHAGMQQGLVSDIGLAMSTLA